MQFLTPNPNNQDFSKTWSNGDVIDIKWNKTWKGLGDPLKRVDLWITWFDEDSFSQLLQCTCSPSPSSSPPLLIPNLNLQQT
jgi:hypothetical protein